MTSKKSSLLIGADHRGFELKQFLINHYQTIAWIDCGSFTSERTDYPLIAKQVIKKIQSGDILEAVLLCGTGVGMQITANRFKGVYAATCWNAEVARRAREEDLCNVLVVPADFVDKKQVLEIFDAWYLSRFKGGIYKERVLQIDSL